MNAPVISKLSMLIPIQYARGLFYPGNCDHPQLLQSDTSRRDVTFFFSPDRWGVDILLMGLAFIETTKPYIFGSQFVGTHARPFKFAKKNVSLLDPGTFNFRSAVFLHPSYPFPIPNQRDRRNDGLPSIGRETSSAQAATNS